MRNKEEYKKLAIEYLKKREADKEKEKRMMMNTAEYFEQNYLHELMNVIDTKISEHLEKGAGYECKIYMNHFPDTWTKPYILDRSRPIEYNIGNLNLTDVIFIVDFLLYNKYNLDVRTSNGYIIIIDTVALMPKKSL